MVPAGNGPPPQRATAISCTAGIVTGLIYDGERLALNEYARIVLQDENPLDCYCLGSTGPDPGFTRLLSPAGLPEVILLAAAIIADSERDQRDSLLLDREPDGLPVSVSSAARFQRVRSALS